MNKKTHQTKPGVHLDTETGSDQALWEQLERLPMALPSNRLRGDFYARLAQQKHTKKPGLIRKLSQLILPSSWVPAFATLLIGLSLGLYLQVPADKNDNNRLDQLETQVSDLNQMLALNLMENVAATERLRGVHTASRLDSNSNELGNALLVRALNDPNSRVRAAAIKALGPHMQSSEIAQELENLMLITASPLLQLELAEVIMRWGNENQLRQLLTMAQENKLSTEVTQFVLSRINHNQI